MMEPKAGTVGGPYCVSFHSGILQVIAGTGAAAGPLFSQVKNRLKPFLSEKMPFNQDFFRPLTPHPLIWILPSSFRQSEPVKGPE